MLLLDATHTSHSPARTGIQRVVRGLFRALDADRRVEPVCFDPYLDAWRPLEPEERAHLAATAGAPGRSRGARWPLATRVAGYTRRLTRRRPALPAARGLVCPELFSPRNAAALSRLFPAVSGPRVALFHDALALRFPELSPPGTVGRMPAYLRELLAFDGIAAVSADSAASLRDYWAWLGAESPPPIAVIPLGVDPVSRRDEAPATGPVRVLCVSTIEGRKNHLGLLEAAELLWRDGVAFELELVGLARPDTAGPALARLAALQAAGRPLIHLGAVADDALEAAYRRCAFTVYPSLAEGFGLPVLESLQHGRPCLCAAFGAVGEAARGGGTVTLPELTPVALAAAMRGLIERPADRAALTAAARARSLRTWVDYERDLTAWLGGLPRRDGHR